MIGDGHAMGVAAEIAQHLQRTAEGWLGVDHPVVAMQAAEELCELLRISESGMPGRRSIVGYGGTDV